jgi:hypothetical protein
MNECNFRVNLEAEAKGLNQVTIGNEKRWYNGTIVFE